MKEIFKFYFTGRTKFLEEIFSKTEAEKKKMMIILATLIFITSFIIFCNIFYYDNFLLKSIISTFTVFVIIFLTKFILQILGTKDSLLVSLISFLSFFLFLTIYFLFLGLNYLEVGIYIIYILVPIFMIWGFFSIFYININLYINRLGFLKFLIFVSMWSIIMSFIVFIYIKLNYSF